MLFKNPQASIGTFSAVFDQAGAARVSRIPGMPGRLTEPGGGHRATGGRTGDNGNVDVGIGPVDLPKVFDQTVVRLDAHSKHAPGSANARQNSQVTGR